MKDPLDPPVIVVGQSTHDTARIFAAAHVDRSGKFRFGRLAFDPGDGQVKSLDIDLSRVAAFPYGVFTLTGLRPSSPVNYRVLFATEKTRLPAADVMLQENQFSFRTLRSPEGLPTRIGLLSCNGYHQAPHGVEPLAMWEKLKEEVDAGRIDLLIHAGDQVYADIVWQRFAREHRKYPGAGKDKKFVEDLIQEYVKLYLLSWSTEPIASVLRSCPSVMMWDDHDIFDGWGSNDEDAEPEQQAFFRAADVACRIFQTSHRLDQPVNLKDPDSHSFGFTHGRTGFILLDARSHRSYADGRILNSEQWTWLGSALRAFQAKNLLHLFVVVGVPPMHLRSNGLLTVMERTTWTEGLTDDLRDAWIAPHNAEDCRRLLMSLFEFASRSPNTMVTILAGDVHVASLARIESKLENHRLPNGQLSRIYQVVSSGIGYSPPVGVSAWMLRQGVGDVELVGRDVSGSLLPLAEGEFGKLLNRRNFAALKMGNRADDGWDPHGNLWVEFTAENHPRKLEHCLYRVGPIP